MQRLRKGQAETWWRWHEARLCRALDHQRSPLIASPTPSQPGFGFRLAAHVRIRQGGASSGPHSWHPAHGQQCHWNRNRSGWGRGAQPGRVGAAGAAWPCSWPGAASGAQGPGRLPQEGSWQQRPILHALKKPSNLSNFPSLDAPGCFPFGGCLR